MKHVTKCGYIAGNWWRRISKWVHPDPNGLDKDNYKLYRVMRVTIVYLYMSPKAARGFADVPSQCDWTSSDWAKFCGQDCQYINDMPT